MIVIKVADSTIFVNSALFLKTLLNSENNPFFLSLIGIYSIEGVTNIATPLHSEANFFLEIFFTFTDGSGSAIVTYFLFDDITT